MNIIKYIKKIEDKMQAATAAVNAAHKQYLKCVDSKMSEYLSSPQLRASGTAGEFCAPEKQAYMDTMKAHFPYQYDNLVKVDASTY